MSKVVLVKDAKGQFTVAEVSNYTYLDEATARAFARDKWGDVAPVVVIPEGGLPFVPAWETDDDQTPKSVSPEWKSDGTGFRD